MEDIACDSICMNDTKIIDKKIISMVMMDGGTVGDCYGGGQ